MRSLALLLILLNISFFTWQLSRLPWLPWQPEQLTAAKPQPSSTSDLPRLLLLSERHLLKNLHTQDEETPTDNGTILPTDPAMRMATTHPLMEDNLATSHTVSEILEEPQALPLVTSSKLQHVAGQSTAAENQAVDEKDNQLAVEQKDETAPQVSMLPSTGLSTFPPSGSALSAQPMKLFACFQAGPYTHLKTAKNIVNWLNKNQNVSADLQPQKTQVLASTWVYLPPFANRQTARMAQQRLNQLGIREHQIIKKGKFNNSISLGIYRQPASVKRRVKELSAKGYKNIQIQKRYKSDTQYWLNVKMSHQNDLLSAFKQKFKGPELEKVPCQLP